MKIFYDYSIFIQQNLGGISRYFVNLEKELSNTQQTRILAPIHKNFFLKNNNYKNKYFKNFPIYTGRIIKLYNQTFTNKYVKNFNPDIYHKTYYNNYWPSNLKGKRVITAYDLIHEIYYSDYGYEKNYRPKKESFFNVDKIISISENTKKDLVNFYNIPQNKIHVIYLGTDIDKVYIINKRLVGDPYILFVGDRKRYKNFFNLLIAYKQSKKIYNNFKLAIFGGGEFSKEEIKIFDENKIDLNKIVKISGGDDILANLYENAELFVFPSQYEGFGLPLLEAAVKKCPIVCSDINVFKEIMEDSVTYFNPNYPEDISKVIEDITFSNEKKKVSVEKAYLKSKEYSWSKCAKETLDLYKTL